MQLRDNGLRFSPITIVLHWVIAVLLLFIALISMLMSSGMMSDKAVEMERIQNMFGVALFSISLYRFWARVTSWHPLPVGTPNPVEVIVSRSVAVGLALAMVLLPIAVWLSRSAAGQIIALPGGFSIPTVIEPSPTVHRAVDFLFNIGAAAFLAGLALHMFGAFKNHFVLKNAALKPVRVKVVVA